jgi:hypothetical protein
LSAHLVSSDFQPAEQPLQRLQALVFPDSFGVRGDIPDLGFARTSRLGAIGTTRPLTFDAFPLLMEHGTATFYRPAFRYPATTASTRTLNSMLGRWAYSCKVQQDQLPKPWSGTTLGRLTVVHDVVWFAM